MPITGWRWSSGPLVVKDVVVVAGVPVAGDRHPQRARRARRRRCRPTTCAATTCAPASSVDVPRRAAQGRVRQRHVAERLVDLLGQQRRVVADQRRRGARLRLPADSKNATGDYYGGTRPGNNLFAESIVCLDAKTGKRVWHFQTLHHGLWDYDLPAAPMLADITVNGRRIKAVAQVSKQAFVYVLDRVDRHSRSGRSTRTPGAAGQRARRVVLADAADPVEAAGVRSAGRHRERPDRLHAGAEGRGAEDRQRLQVRAALHAAVLLGSPDGPKGTLLVPGTNGGADWGGAAFDKETGILYVPSAHMPTSSRSASRSIPSRRCPT